MGSYCTSDNVCVQLDSEYCDTHSCGLGDAGSLVGVGGCGLVCGWCGLVFASLKVISLSSGFWKRVFTIVNLLVRQKLIKMSLFSICPGSKMVLSLFFCRRSVCP